MADHGSIELKGPSKAHGNLFLVCFNLRCHPNKSTAWPPNVEALSLVSKPMSEYTPWLK